METVRPSLKIKLNGKNMLHSPPKVTLKVRPLRLPYSTTFPSFSSLPSVVGKVAVPGLNSLQLASIIAFSHLTRYSSIRIAALLSEIWPIVLSAETVWDTYCEWESQRQEHSLEEIDQTINKLKEVIVWHGASPDWTAKPLNERGRVVTVPHIPVWTPNPSISLFPGYSNGDRLATIHHLTTRAHASSLSKLTPFEKLVATRLGKPTKTIIKRILTSFFAFITTQTSAAPFHAPIFDNSKPQFDVCRYGDEFMRLWQDEFGTLDDANGSAKVFPLTGRAVIQVRSTAHAAHLFVCLVLLDRLHAMQLRRDFWRRDVGFEALMLEELPEERKDCPICQETMGVAGDRGVSAEMPVRMVVCCGNVFGGRCLRRWFGDYGMRSCPSCRSIVSKRFLERILEEWQTLEEDVESRLSMRGIFERNVSGDAELEEGEIREERSRSVGDTVEAWEIEEAETFFRDYVRSQE